MKAFAVLERDFQHARFLMQLDFGRRRSVFVLTCHNDSFIANER
jgi:hypothetical protein